LEESSDDERDQENIPSTAAANLSLTSLRQNMINRGTDGAYYSQQCNQDLDSNTSHLEDSHEGRSCRSLLETDEESRASASSAFSSNSTSERQSSIYSYLRRFRIGKFSNDVENNDETGTKTLIIQSQEEDQRRSRSRRGGYSAPISNDDNDNDENDLFVQSKSDLPTKQVSATTNRQPIMYEAVSFDYNSQDDIKIPSIPSNSFIMPGSDIQKQMAQALSLLLKI